MVIIPAYGKRYKNKEEVKQAWNNNQDFKIAGGPYLNKKDFEKYGDCILDSVIYHFDKLSIVLNQGILN